MAWPEDLPDSRWRLLLETFRNSAAPVQAAVRWVETQGYGGALGSASTRRNARGVLQSLSRFVPELLAKPVVVIEALQADAPAAPASVSNQLWIQTLPSAMQTDILTFLSAMRRHFHSRDLTALASALLASRDTDFWVRLAASNLLSIQNSECNDQSLLLEQNGTLGQIPALEEYNSLPSWLERYKESESVLLSSLQPGIRARDDDEPLAEPEANNHEEKVVHVPGDEENRATSHSQPNSHTKLGKRKHDSEPEAQLQATTPKLQTSQASEDTAPRKENPPVVDEDRDGDGDEDEASAREALGDDLFTRVKGLGKALQSSASHLGLPPGLEIVSHASNLALILKLMKPGRADDETTSLLVGSLLGDQSGYAQSKEILTHVLLPKLINIQEPPSRMLGSAVLQSGKAHPRATVDAVIIPLLLQSEAGSSTVKCDIINRVVKECFSPEAASSLCSRLFCSRGEELRSWVWTEGTVGVVHTLLSQKVVLDEATVEGLVSALEQHCNQFSGSLKFSNLLLNLVSKYGSQVRPYKQVLQQVVSSTKTFLTKSIVTKVAGL